MKVTTSALSLTKKIILAVSATFIIIAFDSCSRKVSFLNSSVVPAARGTVKVKKDNNSNYLIKIHLTHLSEVSRLEPSKQAYVVWMESGEETTRNIGRISSSSSLLSDKLTASFETVSSVKPNKIFITAETDATVQYPGQQIVLSTNTF
jgi:hypothetical protein